MGLFERIEKEIYAVACEYARDITRELLEEYSDKIHQNRDKDKYKPIAQKTAAVKTVYGPVNYTRWYYNEKTEDGSTRRVFLADEALDIKAIGQFSENLANLIADNAAVMSYREAAEAVTALTGVSISHGGVWEVVQKIGTRTEREEDVRVQKLKKGCLNGRVKTDVLFEEVDGVYLSMQGKDRKDGKKQEMKVSIAHKGWTQDGQRTKLSGKVMTAGFYSTADFQSKREAGIRSVYDTDKTMYRIVNSDGAAWCRSVYDDTNVVYQLDRFHIEQEITDRITEKSVQKEVRRLFHMGAVSDCIDYLQTYINSLEGVQSAADRMENAQRLLSYLSNNKSILLSWKHRVRSVPEPPKGVEYKENLGVQENHNFSVITKRMKNNRTAWSCRGATNMAKLLTLRENGTLHASIRRWAADSGIELDVDVESPRSMLKGLSAAKVKTHEGVPGGVQTTHVPLQDWKQTLSTKGILSALGL